MKTQPFYLVMSQHSTSGKLGARRVTQSWPHLESGEAIVRLVVEVPDDLFTHPAHVAVIEREAFTVAVEPAEEDK